MNKANSDWISSRIPAGTTWLYFGRLMVALGMVCLAGIVFASCASALKYPVVPSPIAKTLPVGFEAVFQTTRSVLKEDQRLTLNTIDNAGRFIASEKTRGFIFFQHRTIFDIRLESLDSGRTKITMSLSAEGYEMGGFTLPAGWYPSSDVDTFLGEDIMMLIEQKALEAAS